VRAEVDNRVQSITVGVPADTVAPAIRVRETEIARLEVQLRRPRRAPPNIARVKAALEQRRNGKRIFAPSPTSRG
jgi:hypothetical protein